MNWLPWSESLALIELPKGFGVQVMQRDHITAVIAALRRWYPEITFGVNSCFLREDFYRERVCLDGAIDKVGAPVAAATLARVPLDGETA